MHEGYPILPAYRDGDRLCVYCNLERRWHFHGLGDGPVIAHCDRSMREHDTYVLREVGNWTTDVRRIARGRD